MAVLPRPSGLRQRQHSGPVLAHWHVCDWPVHPAGHRVGHAAPHAQDIRVHGAHPEGLLHAAAALHHHLRDRHQSVHLRADDVAGQWTDLSYTLNV